MEKALPVSKKDLFGPNLAYNDGRLQRVSCRRVALPEVIGELRQNCVRSPAPAAASR
jgi:hypothetical protein